MSWYDYKKAKDGIAPSIIEDVHVAFYSKDYDWSCFDEHHDTKDAPFDSIIGFVENGYQDRNSRDKSRVFIHCTNGNTYELKVENVTGRKQGNYYDKQTTLQKIRNILKRMISK